MLNLKLKKNSMLFKNQSFVHKKKLKTKKIKNPYFVKIFNFLISNKRLKSLKLKNKKNLFQKFLSNFKNTVNILNKYNINSLNKLKNKKNKAFFSKEQLLFAELFLKFKHKQVRSFYLSTKKWELETKPTELQNWNNWWQTTDIIYNQFTINKLINTLIVDGNRNRAENIFYSSLINLKKLGISYQPYSLILLKMVELRPLISFYSKRRGKKIIMIPMPTILSKSGKTFIKWFHNSIQERHETKIKNRLLGEIIDLLYSNNSKISNYKKQLFLTAIENRAFTHFRWGKSKNSIK